MSKDEKNITTTINVGRPGGITAGGDVHYPGSSHTVRISEVKLGTWTLESGSWMESIEQASS